MLRRLDSGAPDQRPVQIGSHADERVTPKTITPGEPRPEAVDGRRHEGSPVESIAGGHGLAQPGNAMECAAGATDL